MSRVKGRVGHWELEWLKAPLGPTGTAQVRVRDLRAGAAAAESEVEVTWRRDVDGIALEFPQAVRGFDLASQPGDDGTPVFRITERGTDQSWAGAQWVGAGQEPVGGADSAKKKTQRVRAQMPGKIVRVMVTEGTRVTKDQPLLVMEAMKMENEIRSPGEGTVQSVKIAEGQAVETGADLVLIDSGSAS